jgi:hypothetical protein
MARTRGAQRTEVPTSVSVRELRTAIQRLPADDPEPRNGIWYLTQKEHWLGWLKYYNSEGTYGRRPGMNRDARYAYNHIVNARMLEWLARASGVESSLVRRGWRMATRHPTTPAQAGAFRKVVSWDIIAEALWPPEHLDRAAENQINSSTKAGARTGKRGLAVKVRRA